MNRIKSLYLSERLFVIISAIVVIFILGYFFPVFYQVGIILFFSLMGLLLIDFIILYNIKNGVEAERLSSEKLSNGDENMIIIELKNNYSSPMFFNVIDEIPAQFQIRNLSFSTSLAGKQSKKLQYHLKPLTRGKYNFGYINIYAYSIIKLLKRRYKKGEPRDLPVYPAFIQMRKYELMAISNNLQESGIKKIRRIGHNLEFEQIKEYVPGDDYRTINWKATARKSQLMVNNYQDEKSQQVYSIIDKGRVMKMPFEGMTLLDYAINASLAISNIAIKKSDKAGLITFQHKVETLIPASKRAGQMNLIMQSLYKQATSFKESDFSSLFLQIRKNIKTRSLILLYTNFESLSSLERQLPYLIRIGKKHLLVTIFFQNTELDDVLSSQPGNVEEVYIKTIAEKFAYEKKMVVKEFNKHGIHAILTPPQLLTINTINKYLELKARGLI